MSSSTALCCAVPPSSHSLLLSLVCCWLFLSAAAKVRRAGGDEPVIIPLLNCAPRPRLLRIKPQPPEAAGAELFIPPRSLPRAQAKAGSGGALVRQISRASRRPRKPRGSRKIGGGGRCLAGRSRSARCAPRRCTRWTSSPPTASSSTDPASSASTASPPSPYVPFCPCSYVSAAGG